MEEAPILIDVENYDASKKYYNEPHSPEKARILFADYLNLTKGSFLNEQKMFSFYLQCKTIAGLPDVKSVLEIGPGSGVTSLLMKSINYEYYTMDAQPLVKPDYLYNFVDFNVNDIDRTFDMVAAFQMLEHVPYKNSIELLDKMKKMSRKYVFISLPYYCWSFRFELLMPKFPLMKKIFPAKLFNFLTKPRIFTIDAPYKNAPNRTYRKQYVEEFPFAVHYWEIGRGNVTKEKLFEDIKDVGLSVRQAFHSKHHPYHYFIVCEKTT